MIVEIKLRGVIEQNFSNLAVERVVVNVHSKIQLLEGLGGGLPKIEEPMFAGKPIGLEQNFVLAVMDYVAREMLGFGMLAYVLVHGSPT
jgi:hypothetical protein